MISVLKEYARDQFVDYSEAKPFFNYSEALNCFYISSALGMLEYRPRNHADASRFRNKFINRFQEICWKYEQDEKITRDLFNFYKEAREHRGVKYRANLRTRLRLKIGIY